MTINNDPLFVDAVLLQRAQEACQSRLQADPGNRAVLRSLAEVYRKQGSLADAAAAYARLARLDPRDQEAEYMHALLSGKEWPSAPTGMHAAPFVLLNDFLPGEFHDSLMPFLVSVQEKFVRALVTDGTRKGLYKPNSRDSLDFTDRWEGKKRFREHCKEILPSLIPRLHLAPFDTSHIEVHVRAYQDGHFFKVHSDVPPRSDIPQHSDVPPDRPAVATRVLSFVYFFHRVPRPYNGGGLLLFDSDPETEGFAKARFTHVVPEDNAFVMFPSNFYHCVVPIGCPSRDFADSRFVINGFVHKRVEADAALAGPSQTSG